MNTTQSGIEKLNMLAAALLTALTIHTLMCGGALLSAGLSSFTSILGIIKALWLLAGVAAGGFLAAKAAGLINARNFQAARLAALGSLGLPFLGSAGAVTAFALLPLGAFALYFLKQAETEALFTGALEVMPVEDFAEESAIGEEAAHEEEFAETR